MGDFHMVRSTQQTNFSLETDYQHNDDQTPPSGKVRDDVVKGIVITMITAIMSYFMATSLLPFDPLVNKGLSLATFIGILWLTEAIHITATAILVPILAVFIGIPDFDTKKALTSFANPIIFIFFGGFVLAAALHIQKLDRKIAFGIISMAGGHLGRAVVLIFGATAFLSMWISNTATAAMMLPLAIGLLGHANHEQDRSTFVYVLLGIAYSASIGGIGALVGSPPNGIVVRELGLDSLGWMKFGLPVMCVMLPTLLIGMYFILRPNLNQKISPTHESIPWTLPRILTILVFGATVLSWIFSKKLGNTFGFSSPDTVIALSATVAVLLLGLVSWKQVSDHTDWGVLMLFGGGIALSDIMRMTGASAVLAEQISGSLAGASALMVILVVATFIIFLTEFTSNTASAALLVPLFAPIGVALGLPEQVLVMVIGIGASCAFMMPVATPPNAIVMGTGYVRQADMMKVGFVLNLIAVVILTTMAYLIWM
ncbi:SLC13 family permease [Moraxella oculi]|uniref:SLC13 family permease n=1 Tax=Moraxella oculi TaxID=2940516 RepID=UPI003AB0267C